MAGKQIITEIHLRNILWSDDSLSLTKEISLTFLPVTCLVRPACHKNQALFLNTSSIVWNLTLAIFEKAEG